jgi:NAD(P)-dependent dehydrogenase (short-subunit alcohol dehydrogenase family)/acyl carrier protein
VWDSGLGSVLHLIQTLASWDWSQPPRLRLVTRGAQAVHRATLAVDASAAALWGLGLSMTLEYPMFTCTLIDLDPQQPVAQHEADRLWTELITGDAAGQVVYRGQQRFSPHLAPYTSASPRPALGLSAQATYLVTGGLGALGLLTARWLVRCGARHLLLVGRSAPSAEALDAVAAMRAAGAEVCIRHADIAVAEAVQALLTETAHSMPPLRGIVHAAGVLDDGVLLRQTRERFAAVMAPKVAGTWFLHTYTRHMPLDFFVCYSSTVGVFGMPGQGNYAAANAFMDALALVRRTLGLPALSIAWSAWAGAGLAAQNRATARRLDSAPVPGAISPEQGLAILERLLLASDIATMVVSPSSPEVLAARPAVGASPPYLVAQLTQLTLAAARARLLQEVLHTASLVLGLTDAAGLAPEERFFEKGMDSLMALDLADRLGRSLGKALPPTLIFDYPTAATLVTHLLELLGMTQTPAASPGLPTEPIPRTTRDLTQLSEDELEALLLEKIQSVQAGRHL